MRTFMALLRMQRAFQSKMSWFIFRGAAASKDPEPGAEGGGGRGREDVVVVSGTAGTVRAAAVGAVHRIVRAIERGAESRGGGAAAARGSAAIEEGAPRDTPRVAESDARRSRANTLGGNPRGEARVTLATPSTRSAAPRRFRARGRPSGAIPESQDLDPDARLAERATPVRANAPRAAVVLPLTNLRDRASICVVVARVGWRARRGGDVGKISRRVAPGN